MTSQFDRSWFVRKILNNGKSIRMIAKHSSCMQFSSCAHVSSKPEKNFMLKKSRCIHQLIITNSQDYPERGGL